MHSSFACVHVRKLFILKKWPLWLFIKPAAFFSFMPRLEIDDVKLIMHCTYLPTYKIPRSRQHTHTHVVQFKLEFSPHNTQSVLWTKFFAVNRLSRGCPNETWNLFGIVPKFLDRERALELIIYAKAIYEREVLSLSFKQTESIIITVVL